MKWMRKRMAYQKRRNGVGKWALESCDWVSTSIGSDDFAPKKEEGKIKMGIKAGLRKY